MIIYPDFYTEFACIGKDCLSTCCAGWGINFDSNTTEFYKSQTDDFGQFINQNIETRNDQTMVTMTESRRCPFLDSYGLCQIYIHYGEEHMSNTCKIFPRRTLNLGQNSMHSFSLSCEHVLELLYDSSEPFRCHAEGNSDIITMEDLIVYELAQFIAWGVELLQDIRIPLGVALGTVLSIGLEASTYFQQRDFEKFEAAILRAPEIIEQFSQTQKEIKDSDCSEPAWQLLFGVIDTFCLILKEADIYESEKFLWPDHIFHLNDSERKQYIRSCYENQEKNQPYTAFFRKLTALSFFGHAMSLDEATSESIFLQDICNYVITAALLPSTWEYSAGQTVKQYLSRLSHISRHFEQADTVRKFVYPVIRDLFAPELSDYIMAFMILFD